MTLKNYRGTRWTYKQAKVIGSLMDTLYNCQLSSGKAGGIVWARVFAIQDRYMEKGEWGR